MEQPWNREVHECPDLGRSVEQGAAGDDQLLPGCEVLEGGVDSSAMVAQLVAFIGDDRIPVDVAEGLSLEGEGVIGGEDDRYTSEVVQQVEIAGGADLNEAHLGEESNRLLLPLTVDEQGLGDDD